MTKKRRKNLIIFFVVLGLLLLHPFGRVLVLFFIPMGINAIELVGFLCFAAVIVLILFPSQVILSTIKKIKYVGKDGRDEERFSHFLRRLSACDHRSDFLFRYKKIIKLGVKRKQHKLVEYFLDYHGEFTLKLLNMKNDLQLLEDSAITTEVENALLETTASLQEIKDICDKFTGQLLANDIANLQADIMQKLKNK